MSGARSIEGALPTGGVPAQLTTRSNAPERKTLRNILLQPWIRRNVDENQAPVVGRCDAPEVVAGTLDWLNWAVKMANSKAAIGVLSG